MLYIDLDALTLYSLGPPNAAASLGTVTAPSQQPESAWSMHTLSNACNQKFYVTRNARRDVPLSFCENPSLIACKDHRFRVRA